MRAERCKCERNHVSVDEPDEEERRYRRAVALAELRSWIADDPVYDLSHDGLAGTMGTLSSDPDRVSNAVWRMYSLAVEEARHG